MNAPWHTRLYSHVAAMLLVAATASASASAQPGTIHIVIETSAGVIDADLDSLHAPISVANFLRYVDAHHYDGGQFHRAVTPDNQPNNAVKIEVIQGGVASEFSRRGWPAIELERTNATGLNHADGALSMARAGPNTATSDFFITIGPQPALDFAGKRNADGQGFAVFGHITRGGDVVRKIQHSAVVDQKLTPPISITRIARQPK